MQSVIKVFSYCEESAYLKYSNPTVLLENRRKSKLTFLQGRGHVCDSAPATCGPEVFQVQEILRWRLSELEIKKISAGSDK